MNKLKISDLFLGKVTKPVEKICYGEVSADAKVYVPNDLLDEMTDSRVDDYLDEIHRLFRSMKDIKYAWYNRSKKEVGLICDCLDGDFGLYRYMIVAVQDDAGNLAVQSWKCISHIDTLITKGVRLQSTKSAYRSRFFRLGD